MTGHEHSIAHEVHALLQSADPQPPDAHLPRASELASAGHDTTAGYRDDFRTSTFLAIQKARQAIVTGASADESEKLLLDAIRAEHWVRAQAES
jgi:hypothetical protein